MLQPANRIFTHSQVLNDLKPLPVADATIEDIHTPIDGSQTQLSAAPQRTISSIFGCRSFSCLIAPLDGLILY